MNDSSRSGITKMLSHVTSKFLAAKTYLGDAYSYLKQTLDTTNHKFLHPKDVILTQFCFYLTTYLVFCYVLYLSRISFSNWLTKSIYFDSSAHRILIVIAYPEDGCMFFGPFIVRMVKKNKCLYLLCLCSRDTDGNGQLHKKELWLSCGVLGVKPENIILCNSSLRVKGSTMWKSDNIASIIHEYVEAFDIDTIVTFDKNGVNGNENHIAVFRAISFLNLRKQLPMECQIHLLDSLTFLRRYLSVIDFALSLLMSKSVFVLPPYEHELVNKALKYHKTQLHWYNRLYYLDYSRFTFVNSLSELPRYVARYAYTT